MLGLAIAAAGLSSSWVLRARVAGLGVIIVIAGYCISPLPLDSCHSMSDSRSSMYVVRMSHPSHFASQRNPRCTYFPAPVRCWMGGGNKKATEAAVVA